MNCNSCGCPTIKEDDCLSISISDLDEIVYSINNRLCNLAQTIKNSLLYNYKCKGDEQEEFTKLTCYRDSLQRYLDKGVRGAKQCLSSDKIQCIIEKVKDIVPKSPRGVPRKDLTIDDSLENLWIKSHPQCVTYNKWNKYSKILCDNLGVDLKIELQSCNFALEVTKKIIPCEVLLSAEVFTRATNELNMEVSRTSAKECKIDWELLLEKTPSCDLTLDAYKELVQEGNVSFDIIKEVYGCDLELEIDKLQEPCEVVLKTKLGRYKLKDIAVSRAKLIANGHKVKIDEEILLQDYKK